MATVSSKRRQHPLRFPIPVTANLKLQSGADAASATKTIAELPGVVSVVQVHPGDEDEHYASMYVVTLDPDLATSTAETLANLVELVKECELNLPRKVRPPTSAKVPIAKAVAPPRRH